MSNTSRGGGRSTRKKYRYEIVVRWLNSNRVRIRDTADERFKYRFASDDEPERAIQRVIEDVKAKLLRLSGSFWEGRLSQLAFLEVRGVQFRCIALEPRQFAVDGGEILENRRADWSMVKATEPEASSARISEAARQRMLRVAKAYYQDGKKQSQIAAEEGISRQLVTKILKQARERGLVTIHIQAP